MAIYNDNELLVLVEVIKDQYDRKVSVPVLRDICAVIEGDIFEKLAEPEGVFSLGKAGRIEVQELLLPEGELPEDEPREFYLVPLASPDLTRAIEDRSDEMDSRAAFPKALVPGNNDFEIHQARMKKRRAARGEDEGGE